ncbi:universal stress protein [Secundilactobacillus kimchicus]|uniref:universal stress protein n=1 Tax=Secundilactobacillus kimchicus TaxID=528209 RepID=UPI000A9E647C
MKAETEVRHGNPKQVIAQDFPGDNQVSLIVMGKSGTDAVDRLLVGSTTAAVVRNATANVLVIAEPTPDQV